MGACRVYFGDAGRIVIAEVETDLGWRLAAEPVRILPANASPTDVGRAVDECVEASRQVVPHPDDAANAGEDVLRAAGVASWDSLSRGGGMIYVEAQGSAVPVTPQAKDSHGGFSPVDAERAMCRRDELALGEAVLRVVGTK